VRITTGTLEGSKADLIALYSSYSAMEALHDKNGDNDDDNNDDIYLDKLQQKLASLRGH
jgi:hypothetical protein